MHESFFEVIGGWKDDRTAEEILRDIRAAGKDAEREMPDEESSDWQIPEAHNLGGALVPPDKWRELANEPCRR